MALTNMEPYDISNPVRAGAAIIVNWSIPLVIELSPVIDSRSTVGIQHNRWCSICAFVSFNQ